MSNNAKFPKGYTSRNTNAISQEYNQTVAKLGQAVAMQLSAARQQTEAEDALEQLEAEFQYAQRQEASKAQAEAEKKAKEAKAADAQPTAEPQFTPPTEENPSSGAV